jgi:hypothetical protein
MDEKAPLSPLQPSPPLAGSSVSFDGMRLVPRKRALVVAGALITLFIIPDILDFLLSLQKITSVYLSKLWIWWLDPRVLSFSMDTNCTQWLRQFRRGGEAIAYNYGYNESLSGAKAMAECLLQPNSTAAKQALGRIRDIIIVLPMAVSYPSRECPSHAARCSPVDKSSKLARLKVIGCPSYLESSVLPQPLLDVALNSPKLQAVR